MSNEQIFLNSIREYGPISKRELQNVTGLSWGLISREVNLLFEKGYLESDYKESEGAGRKAEEYDINRNNNYFIGIDIYHSKVLIILTDMKARVVWRGEREFIPQERTRSDVMQYLYQTLDDLFEMYHDRKIYGIGIAVQGGVNRKEGVSLSIGRIRDWENVPLKSILEERYGVEVSVEHDPIALMKCENTFGYICGQEISDAILVSINHRSGIGMAIQIQNQTYYGTNGAAGEIGSFVVDGKIEGPRRRLENYVLKEHIAYDYNMMSNEAKEFTYREIVERTKAGDALGRSVFENLGRKIGFAVSSVCGILNPALVVIYASLCECSDILFETIKQVVFENTFTGKVEIKLSTQGKDAIALGAALISIENAINKIG